MGTTEGGNRRWTKTEKGRLLRWNKARSTETGEGMTWNGNRVWKRFSPIVLKLHRNERIRRGERV